MTPSHLPSVLSQLDLMLLILQCLRSELPRRYRSSHIICNPPPPLRLRGGREGLGCQCDPGHDPGEAISYVGQQRSNVTLHLYPICSSVVFTARTPDLGLE